MKDYKRFIPRFTLKDGKAFLDGDIVLDDVENLCRLYDENGADEIFIWEESSDNTVHEQAVALLKKISHAIDIPIAVGGYLKKLDDVKKYFYAGVRTVVFTEGEPSKLLKESAERFGKERVAVCTADISDGFAYAAYGIRRVFYLEECRDQKTLDYVKAYPIPLVVTWNESLIDFPTVCGMTRCVLPKEASGLMDEKLKWNSRGISVNVYKPAFIWDDLKKNNDGMVPVIAQDYVTDEVLMLAYMNREAYEQTARTGKMTYYSRSRQELWVKGETSGHYQLVKELRLDCDKDTILARVDQIGAACHTGNRSCFYQEILKKDYDEKNPLRILQGVYQVIEDRKDHPREGSYTNYLLNCGIDKILKKVGEEASEIIIAAKNPNTEEVVYEISDFLYHMMVLMVEKEINWEDITRELADR